MRESLSQMTIARPKRRADGSLADSLPMAPTSTSPNIIEMLIHYVQKPHVVRTEVQIMYIIIVHMNYSKEGTKDPFDNKINLCILKFLLIKSCYDCYVQIVRLRKTHQSLTDPKNPKQTFTLILYK